MFNDFSGKVERHGKALKRPTVPNQTETVRGFRRMAFHNYTDSAPIFKMGQTVNILPWGNP